MLENEVASVEFQAGRIGPPPGWLSYVLAAKWFEAAPWDLLAQEDAETWKEIGMLMREMDAEAHRKASKTS